MHHWLQISIVLLIVHHSLKVFIDVKGELLRPAVSNKQLEKWNTDIQKSLDRNFLINACPLTYVQSPAVLDPRNLSVENTTVLVNVIYPTTDDLHYLQSLPESFSLANAQAHHIARKRGYTHEKYEKSKMIRNEIPRDHPAQNMLNCVSATQLASEGRPVSFYQDFKSVDRTHYISYLKYGFIHPTGAVSSSCGYFQGAEGCETRDDRAREWYWRCDQAMFVSGLGDWSQVWRLTDNESLNNIEEKRMLRQMWRQCMQLSSRDFPFFGPLGSYNSSIPEDRRPSRVHTIVVIDALWDTNYHHFLADSLGRLMHVLPLLRRRTDIYVHLREFELYRMKSYSVERSVESAQKMRAGIFKLLGIDASRLISGPVLAKYIIVPRNTRCGYALSSPSEMLKLRNAIIKASLTQLQQFDATRYEHVVRHFLYLSHSALPPLPWMQNSQQHGTHKKTFVSSEDSHQHHNRSLLSDSLDNRIHHEQHYAESQNRKRQTPNKLSRISFDQSLIKSSDWKRTADNYSDIIYASAQPDGSIRSSLPHSHVPASYVPPQKTLILIHRRPSRFSSDERSWTDKAFGRIERAVRRAFPNHKIVLIASSLSDKNTQEVTTIGSEQMTSSIDCLGCTLAHWLVADVVIAAHGAGLTNLLFLPPQALVVEIVPFLTDITMPVCGYYGPLTALVGGHHYLYVHDMNPPYTREQTDTMDMAKNISRDKDFALPAEDMAQQAAAYYRWLRQHESLLLLLPKKESSTALENSSSNTSIDRPQQKLVFSSVSKVSYLFPATSILHTRQDVAERVVVINQGLMLRMYNSTTGRIPTRP